MFDKVYLFVITSIVYVLSGALAGKIAVTWGIRDLHTILDICCCMGSVHRNHCTV